MLHWEERQMGWGAEGAEPSRVQAVSRLSQLTPLVPKAGLRLRLRARGMARPLRRFRYQSCRTVRCLASAVLATGCVEPIRS